jgi:hypothetical protein
VLNELAGAVLDAYAATICDNSDWLSGDLKTEGANRAAELKSAIANPATTIDEIKQKLDSFQQILLDIGASVYRNSSEVEEDFNYWNDIFDDESDFDDDDFTGGVAPVPRPWKPTPPPLMDGEAVD